MLSILTAIWLLPQIAQAQSQWVPVGYTGITPAAVDDFSFALDAAGNPWIAFQDADNGLRLTVMKYTGSSWVVVGNAGFTPSIGAYISLAVDNNGVPYVAFRDYANYHKASVMKYDGTNWVMVGSSTIGNYVFHATSTSIAFDSLNTPYIACSDLDITFLDAKLWVKKFDGTNWVFVGGSHILYSYAHNATLRIDDKGVPYVAYWIYAPQANSMAVLKYTGTNWGVIGNNSFVAGSASRPFFDIDKAGISYVAYKGATSGVKKYQSGWTDLNNATIANAPVNDELSLAVSATDIPYLAFKDTGHRATVMKYIGNNWVTVGNARFSAGSMAKISLLLDPRGVPYVAYIDSADGNKVTVMKLNCPPEPRVNICAVFTDSTTGMNKLIWDGTTVASVDSYKIYREDVLNFYKYLGSVAGSINSFTDIVVNPASQSYKYKLTILDSCHREMSIDDAAPHKTVCLKYATVAGNIPSVTWNSYEGVANITYTLARSNNGGSYIPIATFGITGKDTMYFDFYQPPGTNEYRVALQLPDTCNVNGTMYSMVTSNTVSTWKTAINEVAGTRDIYLMPNPANREIRIVMPETVMYVEVYSMTGTKLISAAGSGKKDAVLDISSLPTGIYLLRVNGTYNTRFIKR